MNITPEGCDRGAAWPGCCMCLWPGWAQVSRAADAGPAGGFGPPGGAVGPTCPGGAAAAADACPVTGGVDCACDQQLLIIKSLGHNGRRVPRAAKTAWLEACCWLPLVISQQADGLVDYGCSLTVVILKYNCNEYVSQSSRVVLHSMRFILLML